MNYNKVKETKTYINIDYQFISIWDWILLYLKSYIFETLYTITKGTLIQVWLCFSVTSNKRSTLLLVTLNLTSSYNHLTHFWPKRSEKNLLFCLIKFYGFVNIWSSNHIGKEKCDFLLFLIDLIAIDCVLFLFLGAFFFVAFCDKEKEWISRKHSYLGLLVKSVSDFFLSLFSLLTCLLRVFIRRFVFF